MGYILSSNTLLTKLLLTTKNRELYREELGKYRFDVMITVNITSHGTNQYHVPLTRCTEKNISFLQ